MSDECRYCGGERVAPVLDKRIEQAPTAGNKYRTRCLSCYRWLPMTSETAWKESPISRVLPADADPDAEDNLISPDEATDGRLKELQGKVGGQADKPVMTDGGQDVDEEENRFDCPADDCGATHVGYPNECDECGADYSW